jgi:hypothetical protein
MVRACPADESKTTVNGRDKVICVNGMETNEITKKVSSHTSKG